MRIQEFNIYTNLPKNEIVQNIKNVNHLRKNTFLKWKMFKGFVEDDNGGLYFNPNFGPVNTMIILWKYWISFSNLEKGFIHVKVLSKPNYFFIGYIVIMLIFIIGISFKVLQKMAFGKFGVFIMSGFTFFFILIFIVNIFSAKSNMKKIMELLTIITKGEIENIR